MLFAKDDTHKKYKEVVLDFSKIRPLILKKYKNYEELCIALNSCVFNTQWVLDHATESGQLKYKPRSRSATLVPRLLRLLDVNPDKYIIRTVK